MVGVRPETHEVIHHEVNFQSFQIGMAVVESSKETHQADECDDAEVKMWFANYMHDVSQIHSMGNSFLTHGWKEF